MIKTLCRVYIMQLKGGNNNEIKRKGFTQELVKC